MINILVGVASTYNDGKGTGWAPIGLKMMMTVALVARIYTMENVISLIRTFGFE